MSELRNRSQITDDEEHELLIEPTGGEDDEVKKTGKSGVAGDERNILVLLFLYILQVKTLCEIFDQRCSLTAGHTPGASSCHPPDSDKQKCQLQTAGRIQLCILAIFCQIIMGTNR